MKIYRVDILKYLSIGLLLVPGFLYAILSLLISGNIIFFENRSANLFLLNIAQLLSFGVTVAKYASDQMILAKLHPGEYLSLGYFFTKRVIPISILFCVFLFTTYELNTVLVLLFCIPIEVFVIIVVLEMNISRKYFKSLVLNLAGYPLVFISYILLCFFFSIKNTEILLIFVTASVIKLILTLLLRVKKNVRNDVLTLSPNVPFQQIGNYLNFKADQLIIAANLVPSLLFRFSLPADYLFYSKFTEMFSGIATSLSPVLALYSKGHTSKFSIKRVLKNKVYISVCIVALIVQIAATLFLLKEKDATHIFLLIPFLVLTLLIVPVNIINYELYRTNEIRKSNLFNFIALLSACMLILINLIFKSVILFSCLIPLQLIVFIVVNHYVKTKRDV